MKQFVVQRDSHKGGRASRWFVEADGQVHGDYLSEWAALLDAIDAAQAAGKRGTAAAVGIQREGSEPEVVWVYGRDPYPWEPALAEPAGENTAARSA